MTLYLVPNKFNNVPINNKISIDCMRFALPAPATISGIRPVAGGELFDFNYGTGAILRPSPFQLVMTVRGTSAAIFKSTFNNFFGLPPVGFYGEVHTFLVNVHGSVTTMTCEAELTSIAYTQDASWYSTGKTTLDGLIVTFTPMDNFS